MRIGQTSLVYFVSKFGSSILGFVATIYIARIIGAEGYGTYSLALAVLAWMMIAGNIGVSSAVTKRVSEGEDESAYVVSGVLLIVCIFVLTSVITLIFRDPVESYIGASVVVFLLLVLFTDLCRALIGGVLNGQHRVHIHAGLAPVFTGARSLLQIAAVALGFGVAGLLGGYAIAAAMVTVLGLTYVSMSITRPTFHHIKSLYDYAKFAWLGNLKKQSFSWVDVTVLGFFVVQDLIGIYSIAWSIAAILTIFSKGISTTVFPEISEISAQTDRSEVAPLITDAIRYNGLVIVPGLVGAYIVGERVLLMYGEEFVIGTTILVLLVAARMVYAYQKQLVNTLNGIDRPDIAFRINGVFIALNVALNVLFIWQYGWIGAAVATLMAAVVSLFHAYYSLSNFVDFAVPYTDIAHQILAAFIMGVAVLGVEQYAPPLRDTLEVHLITVGIVTIGAGIYFLTLFSISVNFRTTVRRNLPIDIPLL